MMAVSLIVAAIFLAVLISGVFDRASERRRRSFEEQIDPPCERSGFRGERKNAS